jgi:hypothetical protein
MRQFSTPDPPHAGLSRRSVLQGAVALGDDEGADAAPPAIAAEQKSPVSSQ